MVQYPRGSAREAPNLLKVDLRNSNLSGHVPSDLENMKYLEWINMGNNRLTITIPPGVFGLSLSSLNIYINFIGGTIPMGGGSLPVALIWSISTW